MEVKQLKLTEMKPFDEIEKQEWYLKYGYNYIVVLIQQNEDIPTYMTKHFKSRASAAHYNDNEYYGAGDVMTTRQAIKKYEFLTM